MTDHSRDEIDALAAWHETLAERIRGSGRSAADAHVRKHNLRAAALRAYAARLGAEPVAPGGWKLVPIEPATEQLTAARNWSAEKYGKAIDSDGAKGCYQVMLAAAPQSAPVEAVPLDVSELVIAARELMEDPADEGRLRALDRALDRFAARVPYAYEPDVDGEPEAAPQPASPPVEAIAVTAAANDVFAERERQMEGEGWTPEHDDQHDRGELALAAACYAVSGKVCRDLRRDPFFNLLWPWSLEWWKPTTRRRDLVKAGALILAEIERLDRAAAPQPASQIGEER